MHHGGIVLILFVIGSLTIGALLKMFMRNSKLPYTVALLLLGIGVASLDRAGFIGNEMLSSMFHQVGSIDPHLILFLFLPTLIFESAYAMEPHLFFRIAPQILVLAVIGLIIAMVLTAFTVSWILPWGIGTALLFGALISATDPVAVVALLKEKSSRKRLETLIDGESLLNDGTAIVFFSLFYGFALGTTTEFSGLNVLGEFIWVVSVGGLTGLVIGWLTLYIIGKLFNQPLIEITLTVAAAYLVFIIAEGMHVSGVVALVSLALMFSTMGRTRISPEVGHFLHQFWEMMAYMANTLIFIIVGIVIALRINIDDPQLWITLGILYIALTIIRTASVGVLMPLLSRIGVGITKEKAGVLIWGGLRGAVSLSLALSIAQDENIPKAVGEQILFLTAGIVVLTIVINGSTMEALLHFFGLDKLPPAKEASVQKARASLHVQMKNFIKRFENNLFFSTISVGTLNQYIEDRTGIAHIQEVKHEQTSDKDEMVAFMRRLLEIERSDYWRQFEEGYIGRQAAFILDKSVEHALDNNPVIAPRNNLSPSWKIPSAPTIFFKLPIIHGYLESWVFSKLSLSYDVARGFTEAQNEMLRHLDKLSPSDEAKAQVEGMIEQNKSEVAIFIKHLGREYASLVESLQDGSARRLLLNHERSLIWKMEHDGVLEEAEAHHLIELVEQQMETMSHKRDHQVFKQKG